MLAAVALAGWDGRERAHRRKGARGGQTSTATSRRRVVNAAVKTVAAYLGNTPAVCRASYIDPRVIDRYQAG